MHVRLHYIKSDKTLKQRFVEEENNHINLSISRFISSITFKSMTASKSSYLFISTTKARVARSIEFSVDFSITSTNLIVLTAFKSLHSHKSTCMSFTISSSSSQTSILLHFSSFQKTIIMKLNFHYFSISSIIFRSTSAILKFSRHSIIIMNASIVSFFTSSSISSRSSIFSHRKFYMIMNNLFEIFAEISSNKSKNIIQKRRVSSCSFKFRQFRIKSLCQRDFNIIMLARKQFRKSLNAVRKKMRFSFSSMFDQTQIINYFKFAD